MLDIPKGCKHSAQGCEIQSLRDRLGLVSADMRSARMNPDEMPSFNLIFVTYITAK
jgi:hypothetical protein